MTWDEVQGLIRHLITTGAGIAVAHGYISGSDAEPIVGALMGIAAVAWSIASKRMAKS